MATGLTGDRVTGFTGAWIVTAQHDVVMAHRKGSNETHSANVILFPIGYRVGQVWTPEQPPKTVISKANSLVKRVSR